MCRSHKLVGLLLALVVLLPVSGFTQGSSVASLLKNAIPQMGQHVSNIAANGKGVIVKAACLAMSACMLAFIAPDTNAAQIDMPEIEKQLSLLLPPSLLEIKTDWWLGTGMYMDNNGKLIETRVGHKLEVGNLKAYLTTAFRTHPDMVDGIDAIGSKVRLYAGFSSLAIEGDSVSYLHSDNNIFVNGDRTIVHSARNYLIHHNNRWDEVGADFELALIGHEYTDPNAWQTLEDAETMRSNNMSFFRTGISFADLVTHDLINIGAKINASLGAGNVGIAKVGEVYQAELTDWAGGDDVELVHNLLARGNADLSMKIGQHLTLGAGVDITHTIGGEIQNSRAASGNFDITRRIINARIQADVIPQYGVSFNYLGEWYKQTVDGSIRFTDGADDYRRISRGLIARAALSKTF